MCDNVSLCSHSLPLLFSQKLSLDQVARHYSLCHGVAIAHLHDLGLLVWRRATCRIAKELLRIRPGLRLAQHSALLEDFCRPGFLRHRLCVSEGARKFTQKEFKEGACKKCVGPARRKRTDN